MIGDVIERVKQDMTGRMCDEDDNVRILLETVMLAGNGNYLEIGVLHGGSLCAVALLKKELGQSGTCYGIDPLDGYYMNYVDVKKRGCEVDPITKLPVTLETVQDNIERFGLDNIEVVRALSHPLPDVVKERKYAVCYIDGDHWGDNPWQDWMNLSPLATHFVVFDNYDNLHPDVIATCDEAAKDSKWELYKQTGITFILRRVRRDD